MPKTNDIVFSYIEYKNPGELSTDDRELVNMAKNAAANAYAPYSKFKVGAAVRLMSGRMVCGANVENAAFPSGICAERNALSYSIANFPGDKPEAIAISAYDEDELTNDPVSPCGNCRQVIAEEELRNGKNIRIILSGHDRTLVIRSISLLLPLQFNIRNLKVDHP